MTTVTAAQRIGQRIREARSHAELSQRQLSELIAERTGIDAETARRSLNNHETGKHEPRHRTLALIAELTKKPLEFFVGDPEVPPVNGRFRGGRR